jgi:hypothetical protein
MTRKRRRAKLDQADILRREWENRARAAVADPVAFPEREIAPFGACDDFLDSQAQDRLMDGCSAPVLATKPNYGIAYTGHGASSKQDDQTGDRPN